MPRLAYRLYMTVLLVFVTMMTTVIYDSAASDRPSLTEQISPGIAYEYTGWYVNTTKVSLSFRMTIDVVSHDTVTASIQNHGGTIPDNVSDYIVSVVVLHRMDIIGLPNYIGISHTSWSRDPLAQVDDSNGTRAYNRDNGMIMVLDVNVTSMWVFVISETTTSISFDTLDDWVIIGLIVVIVVMIVLIVYALYIYPRIHRYQQKKREVMLGATRKKKIAAKSKPKK